MKLDIRLTLAAPEVLSKLDLLLALINRLERRIFMKFEDVTAALDALDAATNKVAAKVQSEVEEIAALNAQIAAGTPVSQVQLDGIATRLTGQIATLEALAADPDNPIPA